MRKTIQRLVRNAITTRLIGGSGECEGVLRVSVVDPDALEVAPIFAGYPHPR